MAAEKRETIMTPKFRVSFPEVFEAKAFQGGTPTYSLTMLFDAEAQKTPEFAKMKALAKAAADARWGNKKPANLRSPFRDGTEKDLQGFGEGIIFVRASSRQRPGLVDQKVQKIIDQSEFYPGCYARATVSVYAYDNSGNRGVAFGLQNIQKLADGENFTGRTEAENDFTAVEGGSTSVDDFLS